LAALGNQDFSSGMEHGLQEGFAVFLFVVLGWLVSRALHEVGNAYVAYQGATSQLPAVAI
jgi:hypothetical protein